PAGAVELLVPEHGDHDPPVGQAVDGVRGGQLGLADHLVRLDHLVHLRGGRVGGIDDVDTARDQAGDDQVAAGPDPVATGAGVPAEVVQLVAGVRHRQAVDDLGVGLRHRIDVDGGEEVGL